MLTFCKKIKVASTDRQLYNTKYAIILIKNTKKNCNVNSITIGK